MEPDHASSIPAFLDRYPSASVVGNEKTFIIAERFFRDAKFKKLTVKDGDKLDLGKHRITFHFAPMVHWPEVMFSYDEADKVLFTADAFGKFGALSHKEDWLDEARRYYINIVGKYGISVQAILKKVGALDVKTICPLHGPVLKDDISHYVGKYSIWSSYTPEEDGVFIAYASIYGNTEKAAKELCSKLLKRGIKAETADLARYDPSQAVANAFKYSKLVIASVTCDGGILPCAEAFINKLKAKSFQNRTVGFIQNGSWCPVSAKVMRTAFESFKNIAFCNSAVTVNSAMNEEAEKQLSALAEELAE